MTKNILIESAKDLAQDVENSVDIIDRDRALPKPIVNAIADAGLFRLLVPKSIGGAEMAFPDFLSIVRTFAEVDGSTGWCINQNNIFATVSASMDKNTAEEIWRDVRTVVTNGPPSSATATVDGDGYRLTGRWNFSSGFNHATWIAAVAPIPSHNTTVEENVMTLLLPKSEVQPLDTWQVNGLRGTGSFSFEIKDVYIPKTRTFSRPIPHENGPLYLIPMTLMFASGFATVALGIARSALDAIIHISNVKTNDAGKLIKYRPTVQMDIGKAEAKWRSANAFLTDTVSNTWTRVSTRKQLSLDHRIRLRLASTHAIRESADVVAIAYQMGGSDSIFDTNAIQRRFQDINVISQQVQARMLHYETAGQFFLGIDPEGSF